MKKAVEINRENTANKTWNHATLDAALAAVAYSVPYHGLTLKKDTGAARFEGEPSAEDAAEVRRIVAKHDGAAPAEPAPTSPQDDAAAGAYASQVKVHEGKAYVCISAKPLGAAIWRKFA